MYFHIQCSLTLTLPLKSNTIYSQHATINLSASFSSIMLKFQGSSQIYPHGLLAQADRYMAKEPCIPLIVSAQLCLEPLQEENQPIPVQVLVQCEPAVSNEFIFMRCIQNYNL